MKDYVRCRSLYIDDGFKENILTDLIDDGVVWHERGCDFGFRDPKLAHRVEFVIDGFEGLLKDSTFTILPLSMMLSERSDECVVEILNTYRAKSSLSFGPMLRKDAIRAEKDGTYRTFLVVDDDETVLGYMMLGLGGIEIPEGNAIEPYICKELGLVRPYGSVPALMLAQLSYSMEAPTIFGGMMMKVAYEMLTAVNEAVGCRFVTLECDGHQARKFQERGFRLLTCKDECINQMLALL